MDKGMWMWHTGSAVAVLIFEACRRLEVRRTGRDPGYKLAVQWAAIAIALMFIRYAIGV